MMIHFKDRTFCSATCKTYNCHRNWTDDLQDQARKWWDHDPDHAPVAFSDYSKTCEEYRK